MATTKAYDGDASSRSRVDSRGHAGAGRGSSADCDADAVQIGTRVRKLRKRAGLTSQGAQTTQHVRMVFVPSAPNFHSFLPNGTVGVLPELAAMNESHLFVSLRSARAQLAARLRRSDEAISRWEGRTGRTLATKATKMTARSSTSACRSHSRTSGTPCARPPDCTRRRTCPVCAPSS